MEIKTIQTKNFEEGEDLFAFITKNIRSLEEGCVIVITSKIVALSQNRTASANDKIELIKKESYQHIETPWGHLTQTDHGWCINAGIDESNTGKGNLILMPKKPFLVAEKLLKKMKEQYSIINVGILITDTKTLPLRFGTLGRAISYAGFYPFKNYIGKKDLYGEKSRFTKSNIPDALASSAVLVMGEGDEQTPLSVINNPPIQFTDSYYHQEEEISCTPETDIYTYLYHAYSPQNDINNTKSRNFE